jgi:TetR/AcrR family transcriptional regulator, copper-responsive repressor
LGFDPDEALDSALALFWRHGYAATSLDMISEATGVARPSLARVFGDKLALYLRCVDRFRTRLRRTLGATLRGEKDIGETLEAFCMAAIGLYVEDRSHPLGCLIINTAPCAAADLPDVRTVLLETLTELDSALTARVAVAAVRGELPPGADAASIAYLTASLAHSLAVRARAGEPERSLRKNARAAVRQLLR